MRVRVPPPAPPNLPNIPLNVIRIDLERALGVPFPLGCRVEFKPTEQPLFMFARDQCADLYGEVWPESRDFDGAMFNERWGWLYNEHGMWAARKRRSQSKWLQTWPRQMDMRLFFTDYEMIEGLIPKWQSLRYKLRLK